MKTTNIPDIDDIARHVPWARLEKDEDDNVIGIYPEAFRLREGESYLSACWVDFYAGTKPQKIRQNYDDMSKRRSLGKKSGFAITNVGSLKCTCEGRGAKPRVVHETGHPTQSYVAVRKFPSDDDELLEILATGCWSELFLVKDL
jgi:hypothetical protein